MKDSPQGGARRAARLPEWPLVLPVGLMALQVVAAAFFVADGFEDWLVASTNGPRLELLPPGTDTWGAASATTDFDAALKGCDVAEIARLRGAAAGTIRSQLSQIYAKAGVNSQATLVSVFIDDLLDKPATSGNDPARH